jgi:hypothetical protein
MAVALGAIGFGIEHYTATAVTGTAATMVAATVPFLFTDLLSMRQFGVGSPRRSCSTRWWCAQSCCRPPSSSSAGWRGGRHDRPSPPPRTPAQSRRPDRRPRRASSRSRYSHDQRTPHLPHRGRLRTGASAPLHAARRHRLALRRGTALAGPQRPRRPFVRGRRPHRRRDRRRTRCPRCGGGRSRRDPGEHARRVDAGRPGRVVGGRDGRTRLQHELRRRVRVRAGAFRRARRHLRGRGTACEGRQRAGALPRTRA